RHWRGLLLVGALNSAIPFVLFSFAALSITAGLSSIVNATTPLWTAVVALVWLGQRLTPLRVLGLVIGFGGVAFLAWDKASFKPGADHSGL
ncbi:DMT family transporter, partial [Acinetobacter baumannii]